MKDIKKSISLLCPICGSDQFESLNQEGAVFPNVSDSVSFRCSDCGAIYTKETIIEENSELISIAIDDFKRDALHEIKNELKRMNKKWIR